MIEAVSLYKKKPGIKKSSNKCTNKFRILINYCALPIMIFAAWLYVTKNELVSPAIMPSIEEVANSFLEQLKSGQLIGDIEISLLRVIKGFVTAAVIGITLGILMGVSKEINRFFSLTLNSIRQIPMMAWIPLIILWAGIGETSKVVIIAIGAFFPILINTMSGIKQIPEGYVEVGRMLKLSKWEQFRKIYFPSALPSIFVGLKLGLGISWMIVVAAEIVASSSGIGYRINDARSMMQPEIMIVGMFVIGLIGIIMDQILIKIGKKITPWTSNK